VEIDDMETRHRKAANVALWSLQLLLSALFLFAGGFKLTMPAADLAAQTGLPAGFMQLVSLVEVAGGLGLLLPGALRIHRGLTPVAASGLVLVMVGAVVVSARVSVGAAVVPIVVGMLLTMVARGRRGWIATTS
jgi:DoxX-like family